jgi:hypothetical protein
MGIKFWYILFSIVIGIVGLLVAKIFSFSPKKIFLYTLLPSVMLMLAIIMTSAPLETVLYFFFLTYFYILPITLISALTLEYVISKNKLNNFQISITGGFIGAFYMFVILFLLKLWHQILIDTITSFILGALTSYLLNRGKQ